MDKYKLFILGLSCLAVAYLPHAKAQSTSTVAAPTTTRSIALTTAVRSTIAASTATPAGPTTTTSARITTSARTTTTSARTTSKTQTTTTKTVAPTTTVARTTIVSPTKTTVSSTTTVTAPAMTTQARTTASTTSTVAPTTTTLASTTAAAGITVMSSRPLTSTGVSIALTTNDHSTTDSVSVTTTHISTTSNTSPNAGLSYCSSNPCKNGGTCTENATMYTCDCVHGFTNTSCEIEINECETLPCYPFGRCTDKINDYNCSCNAGFTKGSNDKQCINTDECLAKNVTCQNGGTCHDYINSFQCQCPLAADGTAKYYGEFCEKTITKIPTISRISQKVGILSGGAALTVYGADLDELQPFGVNFTDTTGQHEPLFGYVQTNSIQSTSFVVLTPKANESLVGVQLMLVVIFSGGFPQNLTFKFQYVANPGVVDITPRVQLATGGIQLTVMGSNFNAVVTAIMTVDLDILYPDGRITTQSHTQICSVLNGTAMNCQLPIFDLPLTFFDNNATNQNPAGKRRRRQILSTSRPTALKLYHSVTKFLGSIYSVFFRDDRSDTSQLKKLLHRQRRDPAASLNASDGSIANLYLGLKFDDFPKYENISKSLPNITFKLINEGPQFSHTDNEQAQVFDPDKQEPLQIKGRNLTVGCSKNDYNVSVGAGVCNVTALTDNVLTCSPPVETPPVNNDTLFYCPSNPNHLAVMVRVSTLTNFAFCVQYTQGDSLNWVIGVGVGCGCGLLILLLTVAVSVKIRGYIRKRKSRATRSGFERPPEPNRIYGRQRGRSELKGAHGPLPTRDAASGVEMRSYRSGRSRGFGMARFQAFAKRISYTRQPPEKDNDYNNYYDAQIPENYYNDHGNSGHTQAHMRRNDLRPDTEVQKRNTRSLWEDDDERGMQDGEHKWKFNYPNVYSEDSTFSRDYSNPSEFSNKRDQYDRRLPR